MTMNQITEGRTSRLFGQLDLHKGFRNLKTWLALFLAWFCFSGDFFTLGRTRSLGTDVFLFLGFCLRQILRGESLHGGASKFML